MAITTGRVSTRLNTSKGNRPYDKYDNCLYIDPDDDISGHGNHFVDITSGGQPVWQAIMLDSGSYHLSGATYDYDVIHADQIAWYERVVTETNEAKYGLPFDALTADQIIPSVVFFHIPLYEYQNAWDAWVESEKDPAMGSGEYRETAIYYGYYNSGFFDIAKALGSTRGIYCGHDHINDFAIYYEGIQLSYGVKSGRGIYHDQDMIGGQVVILADDGSVSVERIFEAY